VAIVSGDRQWQSSVAIVSGNRQWQSSVTIVSDDRVYLCIRYLLLFHLFSFILYHSPHITMFVICH
jgi:hypothetical protein